MRKKFALATGTAALLSLAALAPARAQYIDLKPQSPQWGLDANDVRVVQFALRDAGCYHGAINGRVTASTRTALRCAAEKNGTTVNDPAAIERALYLYESEPATMMREAPGEVEHMMAPRDTGMAMRNRAMRDSMRARENMMKRDSTRARENMMRRDSTRMKMQHDSAMMRMRHDSAMTKRDSTMKMRRDSAMMKRDTMRVRRDSTRTMRRDSTRRGLPPIPPPPDSVVPPTSPTSPPPTSGLH